MRVPFVDLRPQHSALRSELSAAFEQIMDQCDFVLGKDVSAFESEFAEFCGVQFAVGVASGVSALELCLRAYEVGPGDEVIVPAHTFVATMAAVSCCGACPVLVEVDPATYNIDTAGIREAITPKTRAIIPVHLYGQPAAMDAIMALAGEYDLKVIEDACQAHGAFYKGRRTGSLGHAAAFSFYPTKNLGGCGDGGMIVTNDAQLAEKARALRNCGQKTKNSHELFPLNYRLDTIQAAWLRPKLRHLDEWNHKRQQAAALYREKLAGADVVVPIETPDSTHVYHLYVVRSPHREELRQYLGEKGIGTAIHYPIPVHRQPFYRENGIKFGDLTGTERLCDEILSLPMFPDITEEQIEYVADCIGEFSPA
jgi:dTDP-4-amino-4,6-dideoxygalactose transaminase